MSAMNGLKGSTSMTVSIPEQLITNFSREAETAGLRRVRHVMSTNVHNVTLAIIISRMIADWLEASSVTCLQDVVSDHCTFNLDLEELVTSEVINDLDWLTV